MPNDDEQVKDTRPSARPMVDYHLQFLRYEHLPPELQEISRPFAELARTLIEKLPPNRSREVMVEKLVEAKDNAVRSMVAARGS